METRTPYEQAADRAIVWLTDQLAEDGSFGPRADDLACYYKSPYLLALTGRLREAAQLLDHVKRRFMCEDGDFTTAAERKSENDAFQEYWAYPNAWVALGAQRLARWDVPTRRFRTCARMRLPAAAFTHAGARTSTTTSSTC